MLGQGQVTGKPGRGIRPEPPSGPVTQPRRQRGQDEVDRDVDRPRGPGLDRGLPGRAPEFDPTDFRERPLDEAIVNFWERQVPE